MNTGSVAVAVAVLMLLGCSACLADGGFMPWSEAATPPESGDQRAVIIYEDKTETVILQTAYNGANADFTWVLPTPSQVARADFEVADPMLFDYLYDLTVPTAYHSGPGWCGGSGVGCGASEGGAGGAGTVNVWDQFTVGGKDVAVLSADESADLTAWLNTNGYKVPDNSTDVLGHYTSQHWYFVAVKLHAATGPGQGSGQPGSQALSPLRVSFTTDTPVFPMRISALSSSRSRQTSVLLYLIGPHRMETAGAYATHTVDVSGFSGSDFATFYDAKFRQAIGTPTGFVVEYVGRSNGAHPWNPGLTGMLPLKHPGQSYYVTRLRTYLGWGDMGDDVTIANAPADTEFSASITVAENPGPRNARLAFSGLFLLGAVISGLKGGRKPWWQRALLFGMLVMFVV